MIICARCSEIIVGSRTIGNGINVNGDPVCGWCATLPEQRRRLALLLNR